MDKKTAILQWLNCLTTLNPVNDLSELANGNHFLEFAKTINKAVYEPLETETEEEALERRYNYIKETINSHFHIDCGKLVNFESCKLGSDGHDLILVILLLLSAMVNHSVYSVVGQTRLIPLHELELNTQEFIRECLESILAAEDELQLFNIISNITSFSVRRTRRSVSNSSPYVSPSVTPVLRTRSKQGKAKKLMQSPLKVFMESPNFKQQVSLKEKKKEINELRQRLNSEENKAIDFENKNTLLVNEMHNKEKEIKELKEKVNFLNPFRELADEYELKKAELQEQLDTLEKKQKICANCKHQENCIKSLEDELFELKSENEIMGEKCKHFQAQLDAFHKDIIERDSIINRFTISKSEDDVKIQALDAEINRLLSCEAMYKKRYEEDHAQIKTPEPFQTPQGCEGETLTGVIDKMLQEKEAELEKEKIKIKDLEEKMSQLQSQQKIKDEYNEKLQSNCTELEEQLTKIEKSEKELNSELSRVTAQYDSCVHQIKILENTFAALKLEFLAKEEELQKSVSQLSEKNQQQQIELDHSEKDYKKLLTEKEASEKELRLELEQQQNFINGMQTKITEYEGKILEFVEKVTVLTKDCKNMQEEINAKKEEMVILQREKSQFETELEHSITAQERLRNQHEVACTQFVQARNADQSEVRRLIGEYDSTVVQWLDITKNLEKEKISIQEKMTKLELEKNEIATEFDSWKRNHQILLKELEIVESQLNEELKLREKTIEDCKARIVKHEEEIVSLTERYNVIQTERQDEKESVIQLEKQMNNLVSELQISKEDYQQLLKEKETVEVQLTEGLNLRDKSIQDYEAKIVKLQEEIMKLEEDHEHVQQEISVKQEKIIQLQNENVKATSEFELSKQKFEVSLMEKEVSEQQLREELKLAKKSNEDFEAKIIKHEEEILSLTERYNIIQKERQDEKESVIKLEKQMNNLVSELQISKEDYQQLSKEKETVEVQLTEGLNLRNKSIQDYEAKVVKLQEEIMKLEEDHEHVQQEISVKEEEIIQLQNENVKATSEFELSKQKFEVSLMEKEVSEQQLREELKLAKKSNEDFEAKIIKHEEELVLLKERCNDIQKERQTEKENVVQLEKQVSEIISELQTSKEDCQRLLIDKEMSEAELTEGLNLRDKSIEGYEAELVGLKEEIIMLKKDHENVHAELTAKQEEIMQLQIEKDKVTSELELSKQEFEKLLTAKEVSQQQLKEDLELHEKSIEVFKAKIIKRDEEILSLTERCEDIEKEKQVEKDSLVQMEKQMNEIVSELQASKDDYQQLLKDKETAEAHLKTELNLRDKSVESYKTKVVEFEEEIVMLKNDRENMQQKLATKQEEISQLQNEQKEITSELELSQQRFEKLLTEKMASEQDLKEELKLYEKSIEDFNAKLMKRDEEILSLTEKCKDIQEEKQVEKHNLVQMEQQMNETISELQVSKEKYQQLLKEKEMMEAQLKTELNFQDKSIETYKTKVVEFEEECVMLKRDRDNVQHQIATKQEEITRMQHEIIEISSQLELSQQKFEKLLTEKEISEQKSKEKLELREKSIEDSNAKIMKREEEILLSEKCENIQEKSQAGKDSLVDVEKQVNEIISELQVSKEDYQQLLKDKETAEAQLKTELNLKHNSIESYKTKIVEFEEKIIMLKKDYENVQQEISAKQEEITKLQNGKVTVTAELELFKQNYEKLQEEKELAEKLLKKALDDRDKIVEDIDAENVEFKKEYLRLQEHHQELKQRINSSEETVLQCRTENEAAVSKLQLMEENYQQLLMNCEMHKTEYNGVCDRLKKVTEELANIAQHTEEVSKMKDDHEKALAVERENVTRLQSEHTKVISELDFFKQNYEKLLTENETIEKQLKEKLHRQKKSTEDSRSVIAELERKIAVLNEERECIQKEQDMEKETVFQLQNENTKMVSELALLKANHEKVLMQKQITEKEKLDELHLKQKTIENYELQITELDGRIVILKEELESMKCERDADKEVGIQLQMEKDKAANELNILNETYEKLLAEKDTSERKLNEELQSQKKSNEDYLAKITAFDANIATLRAEFETMQQAGYSENENKSTSENEVATEFQFLRNTYRQLLMDKETSTKHLSGKLSLQKRVIEDYEYQIAQFDAESEISKRIQEDIQQNMDAERERVNQLQTEVAEVTTKLKLCKEKCEKILTEKKFLEKELNEKLNLQEQSVSDREEIIAELHKQITNLKEEQENIMQEKSTEKEIIMQLQNEKNEIITELELLNQNYQKLLTEAEATEKQLSNKLQLQEKAIAGHKTKIAEQDKEILMLTREKENVLCVSQGSVHNAEFELLNENYQKLLSINEATERRLTAECDYLKKTIDSYVTKLVELQNIKKESPNIQLSINPELQKTLQKFASETEHISNQLCIWAKDRTSLMRKAMDTLKKDEQRNQALRTELIKTQQGIRKVQSTGEGKGDVPLEKSEFASPRPDTEKEKSNWFALRYKKLEIAKNEEISNLQTEKNNLLKKLDESLKAAKMSKEKYESDVKKLQEQQDEYKKIAETAMSEIKQMGEKLKSIPKKDDKQLEILTAKYKKAKEIIEKLNREKKDLGKKLDGATERLKYQHENSNAEAIRTSNEECQALRKELEETKKSNEPLKTRIKELDKARLIQEQTCKSLERDLKLAHSQLVRLRKTAERCDDQSLRLSLSSSSSSSLRTPLIKKSKKEAIIEKKHVYVRERVTKMVDDSFLMPFNPESNFNHSFASTTSEGLNKSVMAAGNLFQCADEEEYLNHSSLESLNHLCPPSATKRLSELQKRNTLCPPHMRSSYAVEMQMQSPSKFSDEALKEGKAVRVSPKRKRSSSADDAQKSDKESKVVVEKKKKKKTLKPASAVNSEKFPWSMANRTPTTVRKFMKSIKSFPSSPKPKGDSFWPFKS